jgi:hypothetical protein
MGDNDTDQDAATGTRGSAIGYPAPFAAKLDTGAIRDGRAGDATDDVGSDVRWMSYAELGQARGISTASATRLAFRRKWRRQVGNDGTARVAVPIAEARRSPDRSHDDGADVVGGGRGNIARTVTALEGAVTALRERAEAADRVGRMRQKHGRLEQSKARKRLRPKLWRCGNAPMRLKSARIGRKSGPPKSVFVLIRRKTGQIRPKPGLVNFKPRPRRP